MDLETERKLAAMIMEEAGRLRSDAERNGVAAYLAKPKIRSRANPQFLQATVRSIQQYRETMYKMSKSKMDGQVARYDRITIATVDVVFVTANKIVEVNEMWRRRSVELEKEQARSGRRRRTKSHGKGGADKRYSALKQHPGRNFDSDGNFDDGLNDAELEEFLNSRLKRGRGASGSRMDEPGPYARPEGNRQVRNVRLPDERLEHKWEERIVGRGPVARPSLAVNQMGDWEQGRWKRNSSSKAGSGGELDEAKEVDKGSKKKKKTEEESNRDSKRDSRKKRRKKLEKSSKRRK